MTQLVGWSSGSNKKGLYVAPALVKLVVVSLSRKENTSSVQILLR